MCCWLSVQACRSPSSLGHRSIRAPGLELRAGDDALHQLTEAVPARRHSAADLLDGGLVRQLQASPQGVAHQLAREVVQEVALAPLADVASQSLEALSLAAAGEGRP